MTDIEAQDFEDIRKHKLYVHKLHIELNSIKTRAARETYSTYFDDCNPKMETILSNIRSMINHLYPSRCKIDLDNFDDVLEDSEEDSEEEPEQEDSEQEEPEIEDDYEIYVEPKYPENLDAYDLLD